MSSKYPTSCPTPGLSTVPDLRAICLFVCLFTWWAGSHPQAEVPLADTSRLTRLHGLVSCKDQLLSKQGHCWVIFVYVQDSGFPMYSASVRIGITRLAKVRVLEIGSNEFFQIFLFICSLKYYLTNVHNCTYVLQYYFPYKRRFP